MLASFSSFRFASVNYISTFVCTKKFLSNSSNRSKDIKLMLVTNRNSVKSEDEFLSRIMKAVERGVDYIQLRDHIEHNRLSYTTAVLVMQMMKRIGGSLIINNRVDLAQSVDAHGVHIGQNDLPYPAARELLGTNKLIGLTVDTLENVLQANQYKEENPKEKITFGVQLYSSKNTKPNHTKLWGIEGLKLIKSVTTIPVIVIGGINKENLPEVCNVLEDGDGVAMAGDLWENPETEIAKIRAIMNKSMTDIHKNK